MLAFVIAVLFGVCEMLLLKKLLFSATAGKYKAVAVLLFIKLLSYAAAAALLLIVFPGYIIKCGIGFAAGMPVSAVIYFIYHTVKGKNGRDEGVDS